MRAVAAAAGRRVWAVSGLVVIAALAAYTAHGVTASNHLDQGGAWGSQTRTVTIAQQVTSLNVQSDGAPVQVTGAPVSRVRVSETFGVAPGSSTPPVTAVARNGQLVVGGAGCDSNDDCENFVLTVPRDMHVTVASDGGPVAVSDLASVNLNSGGGSISATGIHGPAEVSSDGGPLQLSDVTGPLQADSGGGSLDASGLTAATATISTDGGPAQVDGSIATLYVQTGGGSAAVSLATAPDTVTVDSDGGPAGLTVPGGPYAVATNSDGGPQSVTISASSSSVHSITVSTGGGSLQIQP